jgi:hypothetical protein
LIKVLILYEKNYQAPHCKIFSILLALSLTSKLCPQARVHPEFFTSGWEGQTLKLYIVYV